MEDLRFRQLQLSYICGRSEKMPNKKPSAKPNPLELQVRKTIERYSMLAPGEHVLVGVSGGADSTALLLCLHRLAADLPLSLTAAHLNHRIRGAEADEDQNFVRQLCAGWGIPFVSEIIEVKQQAAEAKQNLEEFARDRRNDFLRRTAQRLGAQKIAVGHNLNDQAETALFRFIRGSGIQGLSSIYPVIDGLVIRPLLECARESIREYLNRQGVSYREDSSNTDLRHARNRIRHELLPYLEKNFNPRLVSTIARETALARETWSFVESQAVAAYQNLQCPAGNGILLKVSQLLELHPALQKQVVRQAIKAWLGSLRGITSVHIQSLIALCAAGRSGDQIDMPHGGIALRQFDSLLLLNKPANIIHDYAYILNVPGECRVPEAGASFRCTISCAPNQKTMREKRFVQAFLETINLTPSLLVRSRKPGDRYGGTGHRKVKKMLIDGKIPQLQRNALPMIVAGNSVIWIPGFRPARSHEAIPESSACVLVEMFPL
jgi:tRNA(Ile)-lysidine synthase